MLKQGRTDTYQIKVSFCFTRKLILSISQRYDSRVVADNFKFGADKNIIVALEHNVLVANKKDMAKVLNMTSISVVVIKANLS